MFVGRNPHGMLEKAGNGVFIQHPALPGLEQFLPHPWELFCNWKHRAGPNVLLCERVTPDFKGHLLYPSLPPLLLPFPFSLFFNPP